MSRALSPVSRSMPTLLPSLLQQMDPDQGGDTADAASSCNIVDNDRDYEGGGDYNGGDSDDDVLRGHFPLHVMTYCYIKYT